MSELSLGQNGKSGKVDFSKIKSGAKKEDFTKGDNKLASIFDTLDKDSNGILDKEELQTFQKEVTELAGDDKQLSKDEAKQFELKDKDGNKTGNAKSKLLFEFINKLKYINKDVKSVKTQNLNGNDVEVITYNDGHTEEIFSDGSKIITLTNGNKTIKTKEDKNGNYLSRSEISVEDGVETILEYEGETLSSKKVTDPQNNIIKQYSYKEGEEVLLSEEYTDTGGITTFENNKKITKQTNGTVIIEDNDVTTVKSGDVTTKYYKDTNTSTRIIESPLIGRQTTILNSTDNTETVITENELYTTFVVRKDGEKLSQKIFKDGNLYYAEYDGKGNTKVILQNGESVEALADKFGITKQEILDVNGGKIRGLVGEEVLIPGELEADDKRLQNRQTSEEAISQYTYEQQTIDEEAAARKPIKDFNIKTFNTYEQVANWLYMQEGASPSQRQLARRIEDLKKLNPEIKDGQLSGKNITITIDPELYSEMNSNNNQTDINRKLADEFYLTALHNTGEYSLMKMQDFLDSNITPDNIVDFLDNYDTYAKRKDKHIIHTIMSESFGSSENKTKVLNSLISTLTQAAKMREFLKTILTMLSTNITRPIMKMTSLQP